LVGERERRTLGADHGGALADPPERLAKVLAAADEGDVERVLVDVKRRVGRREDLGPVGSKKKKESALRR